MKTSNVIRDDNTEIVLDPNSPEIGLYRDGSKKVLLSPTGGLSDTMQLLLI